MTEETNTDIDLTLSRPPRNEYRHYSSKAYFTHAPSKTQFQQGYLGVQPSIIKGTFHLRYPEAQPLLVERIEITFKGKGSVRWKQGKREYRRVNKFFRLTKRIWSSLASDHFEPIVSLDLPFEFTIPDVSPSSIPQIDNGIIKYSLKAKIYRKSNFIMKFSSKIIEVWVNINRWNLPPAPDYETLPITKRFEMFECQMSLNQTIFDANDTINIPIKFILFDMRVSVKKVVVRLKQYHRLKAHDHDSKLTKKYVAGHEVSGDQILMSSDSSNEFLVGLKLNLPESHDLRCSCNTILIDIWHRIKVRIHMGNANTSYVNFEKDVKIYNVIPADSFILDMGERTATRSTIQSLFDANEHRWIDEISGDELPEYQNR
ncbi:5700_t:CDS:1 [Acaulospora colombiana]|uniref:5700_t:CDS:1 n=1 Tax=Acaulospora colombiana TaxID=27376 RepID=A0ACA9LDH1_9GLOM|nr:5700_t:CDS:1 [Acaulospora colombiana]